MDDKRRQRANLRRRRKTNDYWLNLMRRDVAGAKNYGPVVSFDTALGPFTGKRPDPLSNEENGKDEEG